MFELRRLRFVWGRVAMLGMVLVFGAGCPSSSEAPRGAVDTPPPVTDAPAPAVEEPPPPDVQPPEPEQPPPEPQPPVQPVVEPPEPQPPAEEPGAEPVEEPGEQPADEPAEEPGEPPGDETAAAPAEKPPLPGKHSGETFDPIKVNGPIFVGWPPPKLALVITGRQDGYVEPCGCAGLDRMKGGMSRRHTFITSLREKSWPVVALDVGGIARGFGRQAELKFQIMVDGMRKMGYDAVALGKSDLRLPAAELLSVTAGEESPFLSTNVALFGFDAGFTAQSRVIEAGGIKVGVVAVLGNKWQKEINNPDVEMIDPQQALEKVLSELKQQADYLVLLAHATMEEAQALAERFPEFQVVVTADGPDEPPAKLEWPADGKAALIEVGKKGMDAVVLGLFDDPQQPVRYQRVPLDSRFAASREMQLLMQGYQDQLRREWLTGLVGRAVPHAQKETNGKFVGSKECESCHEPSYDIWRKSGHAKAYQTLLDLKPPRNFDPECVSCHVVGWHPTKYFPYEGGYTAQQETPHLIDVGCETCHGPGGAHVKAEMGGDLALQEKLQKALVITKEESQERQCVTCHDLDNSPDFDFDAYWPHVEHYETE